MEKMKKLDYGNWVSIKIIKLLVLLSTILLLGFLTTFLPYTNGIGIKSNYIIRLLVFALTLVSASFTIYMYICRKLFSYRGRYQIQNKILDYLLSFLKLNNGEILDIGCGNGALSIKTAKKIKQAHITSIDFWGKEWEFAENQCKTNAKIEGVGDRISFQKGDASKLDFKDESFDGVISNFVFHEVKSQKDKKLVVREALRVLKKDGVFVFHDLFLEEKLYGDINEFINELKSEGIKEINIVYTNKKKFIPEILKARFMLGRIAIIYGRK